VQGGYFTHLGTAGEGYDPTRPIEAAPNSLLLERSGDGSTRAVDFDAIEVMNGRSVGEYRQMRKDWYSLLRQGLLRTGTANSDTHGPDQPAGYPRNYVQSHSAGSGWDAKRFYAAIRDGRSFGTNGPLFPVFRVNGGRSGDLVTAPEGNVRVELSVAAAPWVPVDEVRLLVNGVVERRYAGADLAVDDVVRIRVRVHLVVDRDAFVTLEAGVPLDADPATWLAERGGVYAEVVAPGFVPAAFTNPVYIDADGNGRFDPPGLPPLEADWETLRAGISTGVVFLLLAAWWRRRVIRGRAAC
jgi:hypothetical protein